MPEAAFFVLLVLLAFSPPLAYLVWLRNLERRGREPWGELAKMFAWGAIGGIILGLLFSLVLILPLTGYDVTAGESAVVLVIGAVLIAPLAEEPAKALGLRFVRDTDPEPEDGFIYGAASGLGFAAMETLFYAWGAYDEGGYASLLVVGLLRAFSSAFLHASATAITGYAYLYTRSVARTLPYLGLAMLLHMFYNGLLSVEPLLNPFGDVAIAAALAGFLVALGIAVGAFRVIRKAIRRLDEARGDEVVPPAP